MAWQLMTVPQTENEYLDKHSSSDALHLFLSKYMSADNLEIWSQYYITDGIMQMMSGTQTVVKESGCCSVE